MKAYVAFTQTAGEEPEVLCGFFDKEKALNSITKLARKTMKASDEPGARLEVSGGSDFTNQLHHIVITSGEGWLDDTQYWVTEIEVK